MWWIHSTALGFDKWLERGPEQEIFPFSLDSQTIYPIVNPDNSIFCGIGIQFGLTDLSLGHTSYDLMNGEN